MGGGTRLTKGNKRLQLSRSCNVSNYFHQLVFPSPHSVHLLSRFVLALDKLLVELALVQPLALAKLVLHAHWEHQTHSLHAYLAYFAYLT